MSNQTKQTAAQLYAEAGLIYIRAPFQSRNKSERTTKDKSKPLPKPRPDQGATKIQQGKRGLSCSVNG